MSKNAFSPQSTVATFASLPVTGNTEGDFRVVRDTGLQFFWSIAATSGGLKNWRVINGPTVVQKQFIEVTALTTTTAVDPVFSTLLTQSFTTSGGDIEADFTVSCAADASLTAAEFRLLIDGVLARSTSQSVRGLFFLASAALSARRTVAPGIHTITIEFAKGPLDKPATTLAVNPFFVPNRQHGGLILKEVYS